MMQVASASDAYMNGSTAINSTNTTSMIPSSVHRRGRVGTTSESTNASTTGTEKAKRHRPRRQKKTTANGNHSTLGAIDGHLDGSNHAESVAVPSVSTQKKKRNRNRNNAQPLTTSTPVPFSDEIGTAGNAANGALNKSQRARQPSVDEREYCLLCADPIKFYAVGECNHLGICSKCSMRMRMIMNDRTCPMCKTTLDRVIVSSEPRTYESFQLWGDAGGLDSVYDEPSEILFYECRQHYEAIYSLRTFKCRVKKCRVVKQTLDQLKDHLRKDHGAEFCELCLQHQHFFVQEHQVFTKASLKAHNVGKNRATGPKQSGKDFHPMCQFCKRRYYGDMELYEHLERDHFKCHICKLEHEYFRNYASLETHFRREHHLCEEANCLSNRYVVFPNDIEYQAHMRSVHGVQNRLLFNFQVARAGENPIGGTPAPVFADDTPESWNYGAPEERVNPQAQLDTAFPALPTPAAPAPPPVATPAIARPAPRPSGPPAPAFAVVPPRGQIARNQRLAQALGISRPGHKNGTAAFEEEMVTPNYPPHLVEWGKANSGYLLVVERRLERIVTEAKCHSVSLRPMPAEERALMHELASFYGVVSESFGEDPNRRISFYKRENAKVPQVLLSSFIRGDKLSRPGTSNRLSFLPLRRPDVQPPAAAAPAPPTVSRPVQRGWEKIEPPKRPIVLDAWSDDEDADEAEEDKSEDSESAKSDEAQEDHQQQSKDLEVKMTAIHLEE